MDQNELETFREEMPWKEIDCSGTFMTMSDLVARGEMGLWELIRFGCLYDASCVERC